MVERDFEAWLSQLARLLRLNRRQRDDIRRELAAHLEDAVDDLASQGVPRDEALRRVLDDFGDAAELAARFSILGRKRRWMMHGTAAAACVGLILLAINFISAPATPPAQGAAAGAAAPQVEQTVSSDREPAVDETMRAALRKNAAEVSFENLPLEQVLDWLAQYTGTNIHVQWHALEGAGMARDAAITMHLKNVTVEHVLRLALDEAGQDSVRADYEIQDGVLLISTRDALQRHLTTHVYDVRDLLSAIDPGASPRSSGKGPNDGAPEQPAVRGGAAAGGASPRSAAGVPYAGPVDTTPANSETGAERELQELLRDLVDPESWVDKGGMAQMRLFHGALVVRQTESVHREIDELIRSLRDTLASPRTAPARPGGASRETR